MEFESRDFGYFFEAVALTASEEHGFRIECVMTVPLAWQIIDGCVSHHGWVVELWHGRRAYLEYVVDEAGRCVPERLTVRILPPREDTPEVDEPDVLWFEPRHVNACLIARRPSRESISGRVAARSHN